VHLSTRGKYGLKAMYQLSLGMPSDPTPLRAIAKSQGLSESYLEQLAAPLRRAGLVRSVRGARGGYVLARGAGEISVGEIIRALEGPIVPCDCVSEKPDVHHCGEPQNCVAKAVWEKVRDRVQALLDSITLEDLRAMDATKNQSLGEGDGVL